MPLLRLDKKGPWIKLEDVDGETHWSHYSLLTRNIPCVVIQSDFAYLRVGPSDKSQLFKFPIAEKYSSFKKVDERTYWVKVEDEDKNHFWIKRSAVWEAKKRVKISL